MANLTKTHEDKDVTVYKGNTGGIQHIVIEGYHAPEQTTIVPKDGGPPITATGPHSEERAWHSFATNQAKK